MAASCVKRHYEEFQVLLKDKSIVNYEAVAHAMRRDLYF
jgi:hypothetical protein